MLMSPEGSDLTPGTRLAYTAEIEQLRPRNPSDAKIDPTGLDDVDVQVEILEGEIHLEVVRTAGDQVIVQERGIQNGSPVERSEFEVPKEIAFSAAYETIIRLPDEALEEPDPEEQE